jgi:hypothetical protein
MLRPLIIPRELFKGPVGSVRLKEARVVSIVSCPSTGVARKAWGSAVLGGRWGGERPFGL